MPLADEGLRCTVFGMPDYVHRVGLRIRAARDEAGLTQWELATKVKKQPGQISRWENGWNMPSRPNLQALGEALGVPAESFLDTEP